MFNIALSSTFDEMVLNFSKNIFIFNCYLIIELLILIASTPIFKRLKPLSSIAYIFLTVFITNYLVFVIRSGQLVVEDRYMQSFILTAIESWAFTFLFILYFDWKKRIQNPIEDIAKINFLQSKMDPHFLFNCLNTVIYLIRKEPKLAQKMITNLSELIRASLNTKEIIPIVTIQQELYLVDKYLEIEKIRLEERLVIQRDIDEATKDFKIPQFLLQPLVENCVFHGVQTLVEPSPIRIRISTDSMGRLIIELKNNYSSKKDAIRNSNGISLRNVQERIDLYYQGRGEMKIVNEGEGSFYVYIRLPSAPIYI